MSTFQTTGTKTGTRKPTAQPSMSPPDGRYQPKLALMSPPRVSRAIWTSQGPSAAFCVRIGGIVEAPLSFTRICQVYIGRVQLNGEIRPPTHIRLDPYLAILNLAGVIASVYSAWRQWYGVAAVFGGVVCIFLLMSLLKYMSRLRKRTLELEKATRRLTDLYRALEHLHDLVHYVRDELSLSATHGRLTRNKLLAIIRKVLQGLELCFKRVTGHDCYASIMLPVGGKNPRNIKTAIRSTTENTERTRQDTELVIGSGLAGKAFHLESQSSVSPDFTSDSSFLAVRKDYAEFYRSGISTPFRVNGKVYGVVNLDCSVTNVFEDRHRFIVQAVADLIGLLFQLGTEVGPKLYKAKGDLRHHGY